MSARPLVSISTRPKCGILPRSRSATSLRSAICRSVRVLQHRQPLPSSVTSSLLSRSSASSMPSAPNSLTTSAVPRPSGVFRKRWTSVVFPAPRKPVTMVTGSRAPRSMLLPPAELAGGCRGKQIEDGVGRHRRLLSSPSPGGGGSAREARRGGVILRAPHMLHRNRVSIARPIERLVDSLHDPFKIFDQIIVPESQYSITFRFKPSCTHRITPSGWLVAVLRTIQFNHKPRSQTGEVRHIRPDRHLPAKMRAFRFKLAQLTPQQHLRAGLIGAKPARGGAPEFADRVRGCTQDHPTPARFARRPSPSRGG